MTVYLGSTRATAAFVGVIQMSLLARILPTDQYGVMAAAVALSTYLQLLGEPAVLSYRRLGHHERSQDSEPGAARSSSFTVLAILAVVVPVVSVVWGVLVGPLWLSVGAGLWVVSLVQLRWVSIQLLNWYEQQAYANLLLVNGTSRMVAMALTAWFSRDAAVTLMAGAVASFAATAVTTPPRPPMKVRRSGMRAVMVVGLPLAASAAAVTSLSSWPTLAGARSLEVEDFAAYAAQATLAAAFFGSTVGFVLEFGFPQAKRYWDTGSVRGADSVVLRFLMYLGGLGATQVLLFWVFGDWLTRLFLGPKYVGHVIPAATVAVSCLAGLSILLSWVLTLRFRQRVLAAIDVGAALIQVPAVWFATDRWGLPGLILGACAVQSARALVVAGMDRSSAARWSIPLNLAMLVAAVLAFSLGD